MSFILDAIAKSERERQQQELSAPQILALPTAPAPQSRGMLPYIVVAALLLNAAVLFVWVQSERSLLTSTAPPPAVTEDGMEMSPALSTVAMAARVTVAEPAAPEVTTAPAVQSDALDTAVATAREATSATRESVTTSASSPSRPASDDVPGDWIRIGPDTLSNRAQSGQSAETPQRASGSLIRVSSLSELPTDVRDDLPNVVFSGHLYSSVPTSSIVFVDEGRPVSQGRRIADDLYLHEITPTGVVVEFRGYLIDVGVLQNWTLN